MYQPLDPSSAGRGRFCLRCGNQLRLGARFCNRCGTAVATQTRSSIPPTVFTPPPVAPSAPPIAAQKDNLTRAQSLFPQQLSAPTVAQSSSLPAVDVPTTGGSGKSLGSWLWTLLFVGLGVGLVAAVVVYFPLIWEFLAEAVHLILIVIFFPLLTSLTMMIVGFITEMVVPGAGGWMARLGLWLLTQGWWWFPIGQLLGLALIIAGAFS
jgi:hypothetical protein